MDVEFTVMTLLSYPRNYESNGEKVKEQLGKMLNWWRYKAEQTPSIVSRETFYYAWFLEFQTRGAPHFHVMTTFSKAIHLEQAFRRESAKKWAEIVLDSPLPESAGFDHAFKYWEDYRNVFNFHKHPKNWTPIRSVGGALRYAAKYAAKSEQKVVPRNYWSVGRFWGVSRNAPEKPFETLAMTEDELSALLHGLGHPAKDWEIPPKHLYNLPETGGQLNGTVKA